MYVTDTWLLEMSLNIDTISGSVHDDCSENLGLAFATQREVKETFVIDGTFVGLQPAVT